MTDRSDSFRIRIETALKIVQLLVLIGSIPAAIYVFFQYETLHREIALQNAKVQREIFGINLSKQQSIRFDITDTLNAVEIGSVSSEHKLYAVDLSFEAKNISDTTITIPSNHIDIFIGKISITIDRPEFLKIINYPDIDISDVVDGEVVKWDLRYREITILDESIDTSHLVGDAARTIETVGGWGVGIVDNGEKVGGGLRMLVSARPDEYIGYRILLNLESGNGEDDQWVFSNVGMLKVLAGE